MKSQNCPPPQHIKSTVIKILFIIATVDTAVLTDNYRVVKDQQNVQLCAIATKPDKTIKLVRSPILCSGECSLEETCAGFNYRPYRRTCELFKQPGPMMFDIEEECFYYMVSFVGATKPALNSVKFGNTSTTSLSNMASSLSTDTSVSSVSSSSMANLSISTLTTPNSNSNSIMPTLYNNQTTSKSGVQNSCTDLTGSVIIQKRASSAMQFNRSWPEYKSGFNGSNFYWLGLDTIHQVTTSSTCHICFQLSSSTKSQYIEYYPFQIGDESSGYQLMLGVKIAANGTIGDAMGNQNYQMFSTYDVDNDQDTTHSCASTFGAGWWYGSHTSNSPYSGYSCGQTNVNSFLSGFYWTTWGILGIGSALVNSTILMNCA